MKTPIIIIIALISACCQAFSGVGDSPEDVAKAIAPDVPIVTEMDGYPALIVPDNGDHGVILFNKEKTKSIAYIWPAWELDANAILTIQKSYKGEWVCTSVTEAGTFWHNGELIMCLYETKTQRMLIIANKEGADLIIQSGKVEGMIKI